MEVFTEEEKKNINSVILDFPKSIRFPGHYLYNSYRYSKLISQQILPNLAQYDFIYSKGFSAWHLLKHRENNLPKIGVNFHGFEMFQKPPNFISLIQQILFLRKPVKQICDNADVVFSYGGKVTDLILSLGVRRKNIFELPSGVEEIDIVEKVNPVADKIKFVYLGRYERRKGIEELHETIKKFNGKEAVEFHFIGDIPDELQINHDLVKYHGMFKDKAKLKELITQFDILICPSFSEGFPNVILEAMAYGLTVMATKVGAIETLVNDSNGFILESNNPNYLHETLMRINLMGRENILDKKQKALLTIKEKFTWEKLINELIAFLKPKQ
ncbi:MAG: glycosyltransferase family 4 protein [Bacteroidia bacterium]